MNDSVKKGMKDIEANPDWYPIFLSAYSFN